jgi:tripartite ATP-independent transporter DctM subunit
MLVLLALGFPVYLSMAAIGFAGSVWTVGLDGALANLGALAYQWSSKWTLTTVPLFVLMGYFATNSGITKSLYGAATKFVGHHPGGLAMATTVACTGFGAISGSSVANAAAMGAISIPEMDRAGYDMGFSAGAVAAGGSIGTMMPPSTGFIIMGAITNQSIAALFLAGVLPALLMMSIFMLVIFLRVKINPKLCLNIPTAASWKERFVSLWGILPVLVIFSIVMGGMFFGIFTPTEAGAVGALSTFVALVASGKLSMQSITYSLTETVKLTCMIFLIFIGAAIFGNFLALSGLPIHFAEWLVGLPVPPYVILAVILAAYIPMGCFMDSLSAIMITLPIFYPVIEQLGFNLVWFVVLVEVMGEIGVMTPPVGINVFVLKGITSAPIGEIFRGVMPFVYADLILLVILMCFPPISLWLPTMAGY